MRPISRLRTVLRLTIAIFALIGQSAFAAISAAPDDAGAAAHVERSGVAVHHAHNEATCVVCRVLSLHGRVPVASGTQAPVVEHSGSPESVLAAGPQHHSLPSNLSRAPPANA